MIYILFFGLCCMFVTAYLMNQKDILSPWVITIGMFLVSTFFAILNIDTWQFTLSPLTVFVILTGVFAFGVGEILISAAFEKHAVPKRKQNRGISRIEIPQTVVIVIVLGMVAGLAVMIKQTYEISLLAGNTNGLASMLEYARKMYIIPGYDRKGKYSYISARKSIFSGFFIFLYQ